MRLAPGYTVLELLIGLAIIATAAGVAVPLAVGGLQTTRLNAAGRALSTDIAAMRLQAVTKNRAMRLRLNCPAPGLYRAVEWTGNAGIDTAANRCLPAAYPYPDPDPVAAPNIDLPLRYLPAGITFGAVQEIHIDTRGRVTAVTGGIPATIGVTDGTTTRQVRISAAGQVQIQ